MQYQRKLIKSSPAYRVLRELGPKGVSVVTSGFPTTREYILSRFINPKQTGAVHALVDSEGITQLLPYDRAAIGETPQSNDGDLKILLCEPAGENGRERRGLSARARHNLAVLILYLCRHFQMEPSESTIHFDGKASEFGISLLERPRQTQHRKRVHSAPSDKRFQFDGEGLEGLDSKLVIAEVKELQVDIARSYAEINTNSPKEAPVDAIGVGDVVLFMGGDLYKSRGASSAQILDAMPNLGVVREIYPGSKYCYGIAFPQGLYFVRKSTVRRAPCGMVEV